MSFSAADKPNTFAEFHVREALSSADNAEAAEAAGVGNDATLIREMIQGLADFIQKPNGPKIDADQLQQYLKNGAAKALIATVTIKVGQNQLDDEKTAENVAAYAIYYECPSIEFGKVLSLDDLYVRPTFRRQKLGSKLMQTLINASHDSNCDSLMWTVRSFNTDAIRFYERIGAKELTAKSANGKPKVNCWSIKASEFGKILQNAEGCPSSDMILEVLNEGQLKGQLDKIAENCFLMDEKETNEAEKEHFKNALQICGFEAIRVQKRLSSNSVLGLALFHRCAFSSWLGPFFAVDWLKVRSDCRRRTIGKQMAMEIIRIAAKANCPKINWMAKKDRQTDAFFNSLGATNLTEKENCSLFMLNVKVKKQNVGNG